MTGDFSPPQHEEHTHQQLSLVGKMVLGQIFLVASFLLFSHTYLDTCIHMCRCIHAFDVRERLSCISSVDVFFCALFFSAGLGETNGTSSEAFIAPSMFFIKSMSGWKFDSLHQREEEVEEEEEV